LVLIHGRSIGASLPTTGGGPPSGPRWTFEIVTIRLLAVHGLSVEFSADKRLFGDVADEFLAFVGDAPLVAHNAGFDIAFLNAELKRTAKLTYWNRARERHAGVGATQAFRGTTSGLHCARSSGERPACTRCTIWRRNSGAWGGLCLGHNGLIPATKLGQLQLLRCTDLNRLRGPAILSP